MKQSRGRVPADWASAANGVASALPAKVPITSVGPSCEQASHTSPGSVKLRTAPGNALSSGHRTPGPPSHFHHAPAGHDAHDLQKRRGFLLVKGHDAPTRVLLTRLPIQVVDGQLPEQLGPLLWIR